MMSDDPHDYPGTHVYTVKINDIMTTTVMRMRVTREKGRERCCVEFYVLLLAAGSRLTNLYAW